MNTDPDAGSGHTLSIGRLSGPLVWLGRRAHVWASVLALCGVALLSLQEPGFTVGLRNAVFDAYQRLRPRSAQDAPVRIVDIDEESLARIGQWPWPRTQLAALVEALHRLGAAVVVLDILLAEADRMSPVRLAPPTGDAPGSRPPAPAMDHDVVLAQAMALGRVVTGFALVDVGSTALPALKAGFAWVGDADPVGLPRAPSAVGTLPELERAAAGNGALSISLSAGGVIRHLPLLLRVGERIYPSLFAEALRVAQGGDTYVVRVSPVDRTVTDLRIGAFDIPTDASGQLWLYASEPATQRYIPVWKVLAGEVAPEAVAGTIVLIGSTARGLQDVHQTPLGDDVPGVEFHAQALEQTIREDFLRRPAWSKAAEIVFLLGVGALVLAAGGLAGPTWTAVAAALAIVGGFAASWVAFVEAGLLLDPLFAGLAVVVVYFVFSLLRHLQTERKQRWIRKAFASYISPKLVSQLVENPGQLQLGGERRELTFLFTDLEGFTPLVEQNPPSVVVPALNAYLDGMIRIAFLHDGTVDKIIGDAVHVMFGAPVADPAHAQRSVACALDLDRFAREFAAGMQAEGLPFGRTRIGINSGNAIVGNFGGELRFDYTAHGDAINTAARLEGANRYLGTHICVSERVKDLCPGFVGRPAGTLVLKGKTEPIATYEPQTDAEAASALTRAYLAAFALMEAGEPDAEAAFALIVARWPEDPLARFHLDRLRAGESGSTIVLAGK